MSVELQLNAVNLALVAFSRMHNELTGQVLAFFSMVVAAAEVVVGLAIIVALFRRRGTIDVDDAGAAVVAAERPDRDAGARRAAVADPGAPARGRGGQPVRRAAARAVGRLARVGGGRAVVRRVGRRWCPQLLALPAERAPRCSSTCSTGSRSARSAWGRPAAGRAERHDDPRGHRGRRADPLYSIGYMAGDPRLRAVLRLPEPVRVLHADAGPRRPTTCCCTWAGRASGCARTC